MAKEEYLRYIIETVRKGQDVTARAVKDIEKVGDAGEKASTKTESLSTSLVTAGAAAAAVGLAAKKAYELIGEGADLQLARSQFDNLSESIGATSDALLDDLRAATKGMQTDAELIVGASDIISLGLADSKEGVTRLATAVGTLGLDMQQVILTFANNSKARLDALGLSVEGVTKKAEELEAQGFVGDAFDEAVLIGLEEKMTLLGDASETSAGKLDILETKVANAKDEFKLFLLEAMEPTIDALITLNDVSESTAIEDLTQQVIRQKKPVEDLAAEYAELVEFTRGWDGVLVNISGKGPELRDSLAAMEQEIAANVETGAEFIEVMGDLTSMTEEQADAFVDAAREAEELDYIMGLVGESTRLTAIDADNFGAELYEMGGAMRLTGEDADAFTIALADGVTIALRGVTAAAPSTKREIEGIGNAASDAEEELSPIQQLLIELEGERDSTINFRAFGIETLEEANRLLQSLQGFSDPYGGVDPYGETETTSESDIAGDAFDPAFDDSGEAPGGGSIDSGGGDSGGDSGSGSGGSNTITIQQNFYGNTSEDDVSQGTQSALNVARAQGAL